MLRLDGDRTVRAVAYSPCGRYLAAAGYRHVCVWNLSTGRGHDVPQPPNGFALSVAFSPDGGHVAWADAGGVAAVPVRDGVPKRKLRLHSAGAAVGFLPDGRWVTVTGQHVVAGVVGGELTSAGSAGATAPLAVSPGLGGFATAHPDRQVALFDAQLRRVGLLHYAPGDAERLALSADGSRLAAACSGGLAVWDVGRPNPVFTSHAGRFGAVAFTPDGRWLLAGGRDTAVRMWDATSWGEPRQLDWQASWTDDLAVSPDGLTAAAVGLSREIVVWDLDV